MVKIILFIMLFVSGTIGTWAQPVADDDIKQLQKQMYQLYNKNDEAAFIDITNQLKEAAQKAGDDRLQQMLQEMKSYTAKQIIDAFSQSVESHRNGAEPNDDLTMLAIKLG